MRNPTKHTDPRSLDAVIRVSRVNGRKGDAFLSPDEQRDTIDRWAAAHGVTIARYHEELDVSGGTTEREGLQNAVARALSGEVDGIVVAKVDRFARNLVAGLTAYGQLRQAKRTFVAVKDGIDGEQASTPTGRMLLGILLLFAQWQLESLTEQWATVRAIHIAAGVPVGVGAYGYYKGDDRRLFPDPEEAPWVVRIFEARAAAMSWTAIADMLNDGGARPRRAQRFTHARVKDIVENRVYLGEVRSGKLVNADAHPPLVSRALWDAANGQRQTAARRNQEPFLLAGLIRCPACGVRMSGLSEPRTLSTGETVLYRYYRCRRNHSFGKCPAPARVRADHVEPVVVERFRELYLTDSSPVAMPVVGDAVSEATAALDDAIAEMRAFVRVARALEQDMFEEGRSGRQAAIDAAREQLQAARLAETGVALPHDLADEWDTLSVDEQRAFLSRGLAVVTVAPGRSAMADRAAIWAVGDPSTPTGLPGVGSNVAALVPLCVPAQAGVTAGD